LIYSDCWGTPGRENKIIPFGDTPMMVGVYQGRNPLYLFMLTRGKAAPYTAGGDSVCLSLPTGRVLFTGSF
jgi:hypothetical protein